MKKKFEQNFWAFIKEYKSENHITSEFVIGLDNDQSRFSFDNQGISFEYIPLICQTMY